MTAYVYGETGAGKTTLATLLALALNADVCIDFCPTDPGDELGCLIQRVKPTPARPLVILLDEAGDMIADVHEKRIAAHRNIPVAMRTKASYNKLLDYVNTTQVPLIVLMTSNRTEQEIDAMDASYLRDGRVHLVRPLRL